MFEKYSGAGNDFILIDNRKGEFSILPSLIQNLCCRKEGIGADGLILREHSADADARMRIFNSDGSEAEMCGNGLRCFAKWLFSSGENASSLRIQVMDQILRVWQKGEEIATEMRVDPKIEWNTVLPYQEKTLVLHHLNTGVPHTVLMSDNIQDIDLMHLGPFLRNHPHWQPKGTNVTLAEQIDPHTYRVRTYERGVEGETLACGTGAAAAALTAAYLYDLTKPITLETLSKESLRVEYQRQGETFSQVTLTGPAEKKDLKDIKDLKDPKKDLKDFEKNVGVLNVLFVLSFQLTLIEFLL